MRFPRRPGERDAVVQYLASCGNFRKMQRGRLEEWKKIIAEGGVPVFGWESRLWLD